MHLSFLWLRGRRRKYASVLVRSFWLRGKETQICVCTGCDLFGFGGRRRKYASVLVRLEGFIAEGYAQIHARYDEVVLRIDVVGLRRV